MNDSSEDSVLTVDTTSEPFVGRWNRLISTTNWEKGKIIHQWRSACSEHGGEAKECSDQTWVEMVGGVTAPHVGRLRRVYERFGDQYESYPGLYWTHFLAAFDWDDAPLWLEGAMRSGWSVNQMRRQRWEAHGAAEEDRPRASDLQDTDLDEDAVIPAQGGSTSEGRFDDHPGNVSAGPLPEGPDFGEEATTSPGASQSATGKSDLGSDEEGATLVQPFAGLAELPSDLSEALEMFKLAIVRHKMQGWSDCSPEHVLGALEGLKMLVLAPAQ